MSFLLTSPRTAARHVVRVAAICAVLCLAAPGAGWAQAPTDPPPTENPEPPPPTAPPTDVPPPTARATEPPPPTARPSDPPDRPTSAEPTTTPEPTTAPQRPDDEDEDRPQQPPPTEVLPGGPASPEPTRTRRSTRTPRTTPTSTPTPMVAGALRLTLAVDPPVPTAGTRVGFLVLLGNLGASPATDVTLEVLPPADAIVDQIEPDRGVGYRDGGVVRWVVPRLEAGGEARLRLEGVLSRTGRPDGALCAVLLSAGAPLEHCVPVETVAATGRSVAPGADAPLTTLPTAVPAGALPVNVDPSQALRWVLLVLGLAGLGAWVGLRRDR